MMQIISSRILKYYSIDFQLPRSDFEKCNTFCSLVLIAILKHHNDMLRYVFSFSGSFDSGLFCISEKFFCYIFDNFLPSFSLSFLKLPLVGCWVSWADCLILSKAFIFCLTFFLSLSFGRYLGFYFLPLNFLFQLPNF